MKKLLLITISIFFIFITAFSSDNSLTNITNKGEIIIGLDDTFAPMGFRDQNGNIVGFDIDLATEVCNRIGVKPIFKATEWDGIIFELRSKKIDLIWNGLTVTPQREKQISFSTPYLEDNQVVVVKDANINSLEDLNNKTIGLQMGSSAYFAFEKSPISKSTKDVKKYSSNVEALLDLEAGRTQGVVIDSIVAKYYMSKKSGFKILSEPLSVENIAIGLRKKDVTLKDKINKTINDMKKDGSFNKIYTKWFGSN
nr:amino acid ABC transporter substrate-binding protein [uncultured Cetobacterium sp.]